MAVLGIDGTSGEQASPRWTRTSPCSHASTPRPALRKLIRGALLAGHNLELAMHKVRREKRQNTAQAPLL